MHITSCARRWSARLAAIAVVIAASTGCGIEKQSAPGLAGPSEFATSIELTASPDTLARDGASQSAITVSVRGVNGAPVPNQRLTMFVNAGSLSQQEVTTGSNGQATLTFTAPSLQDVVTTAVVSAMPIGTNVDNANSRSVSIALLAPASASPSFTVSPAAPVAFQLTTFDASGTTISGTPCGSACTYSWAFGSENTATGQIATYRFQTEAIYVVTLTVTSPGGVQTQTQRTVNVGQSVAPIALFTFSPTDPRPGETIHFNANGSTAANGATIVSYAWDFGFGGPAGTGATPSQTFPNQERTFLVTLTVTDSRGQTATVTRTVALAF